MGYSVRGLGLTHELFIAVFLVRSCKTTCFQFLLVDLTLIFASACQIFTVKNVRKSCDLITWGLTLKLLQVRPPSKENHCHPLQERRLYLTVILQADPHPMKIFMNRNISFEGILLVSRSCTLHLVLEWLSDTNMKADVSQFSKCIGWWLKKDLRHFEMRGRGRDGRGAPNSDNAYIW